MLHLKKKSKIFIFTISFFVFFLLLFGENIKDTIKSSLNDNNVIKYKFFKDLVKVIGDPRYIMNDYNVNFLPKTQFLDFEISKFKINKNAQDSHFIEIVNKNLLVTSNNLKIYIKEIENIDLKKKRLQLNEINNNLQNFSIKNILDTKFHNNNLYVSYKRIINSNCNSVGVVNAIFDIKYLKFEELFSIDECANGAIWGGAIDIYETENGPGILLSTSDVIRSNDEDISNERDRRAQENKSFFHIGPPRDSGLYNNFKNNNILNIKEAEYLLCTGLFDEHDKELIYYKTLLQKVIGKIMICTNPDLIVDRGKKREFCAGSVAKVYEDIGGKVEYFGKPYPKVYNQSTNINNKKVLCIGDNLDTDIRGANKQNFDSFLISDGIHKQEISNEKFEKIKKKYNVEVDYIQKKLQW